MLRPGLKKTPSPTMAIPLNSKALLRFLAVKRKARELPFLCLPEIAACIARCAFVYYPSY